MRTHPRPTDEESLPKEDPKDYLLRLLAGRDYSRAKLEAKLRERRYEPQQIREALDELEASGLFRETAFADARIRAFLSKNYGPRWIQAKLRAERVNVTMDQIDAAYDYLGFGEADQVRELVRKARATSDMKRREAADPRAARTRLVQKVMAKGHSATLAMRIVDEMKA